MRKTQKFFRVVWHINAIVILAIGCATVGVIGLGVTSTLWGSRANRQAGEAAPPITSKDSDHRFVLGAFSLVEGTSIYRAQLTDDRAGKEFGSRYGYEQPRNILLIDSLSGSARWLLDGDGQIITYTQDIIAESNVGTHTRRTVASLALAKPATANSGTPEGRLLLFDPAAHEIQSVADNVRAVYSAELATTGDIIMLYERGGKYVLGQFDASTLRKKGEREVTVPPLK
jgi:hypothetical protein